MSGQQVTDNPCLETGERHKTPDILTAGSDERFFQSLYQFIEHEKLYLECPTEGPDELLYIIYRSVFNKVIGRATAYKRLLLTIKAEYDDAIRELQRREEEARETQQTLAASASHPKSLIMCQRRIDHLRDRLSALRKETAEHQEEIKKQKSIKEQSTWIPGLTVAQSKDFEALNAHLNYLEAQRDALLSRKSHCISVEVKTELDAKLHATEQLRNQLSTENVKLKGLFKCLKFVSDRLCYWRDEQQQVPLEELLGSTMENFRQSSDEDSRSINVQLFEDDEPCGVDQSKLLSGHLEKFIELFDSAQYEEAALHAARSPRGVLRNLDTMEMFKGVTTPQGSFPPLLLFFEALLLTLPAGDKLSAALSVEMVDCALQHNNTQLVNHTITHNKLTCSQVLGDILTEHAQKNSCVSDLCLALATVTYEACRLDRKTALSMCKRGLFHSTAEFISNCKDLTAEDCMWVLYHSPSLLLLQLLTESQQDQAAILSAGVVLSTLLTDPSQQELALQLLNSFVSRGQGVLEKVILEDSRSSVDDWSNIASQCSRLNHAGLSQVILSILLDQSGTRVLSPDLEGAGLIEHIFF
ncbi:clathrin heavy chain linker domain-containing protein 1-like [Cheilinus undulatus]|uniref:clathrin heavy chain linker domain-containing protein 1-like n=1 Tax=Cheilinus undulatus TaxID=241271 RepID=UPI001BD600B9|nr:clathrin heavy chain linker domain-containing protein 1-like [Cheilinus undulatus]